MADGLGRKKGMFVANVVVVIGSVVQAAAMKRRDMIAGRVVLGVGSVLLGTVPTRLRQRLATATDNEIDNMQDPLPNPTQSRSRTQPTAA